MNGTLETLLNCPMCHQLLPKALQEPEVIRVVKIIRKPGRPAKKTLTDSRKILDNGSGFVNFL
jgi:hypothetical protein